MDTYGRPARAERGEADGGTRSELKELRHLRREIAELWMERECLSRPCTAIRSPA